VDRQVPVFQTCSVVGSAQETLVQEAVGMDVNVKEDRLAMQISSFMTAS
jgi:hypothetical protein